MKSFRSLLGLVVALVVLAQSQVQAASDIFIRLVGPTGVPAYTGDSTHEQFKGSDGWFGVNAVSFGMENSTTIGSTSGGAGAGKASPNPLSMMKFPNSASAALFTSCAVGGHWDTAEIVFTRPSSSGGKALVYMRLELKMVIATNLAVQMSSGDDAPTETTTLQYGAQRITFFAPNPTNPSQMVQTGQATWSFVRNAAVFEVS